MTDKDLAAYGERLWTAIIETELQPIEVGGLTAALRARTPWSEMGPGLKLAIFQIARNATPPEPMPGMPEASNETMARDEISPDDGAPLDDAASVGAPAVNSDETVPRSEATPEGSAPDEGATPEPARADQENTPAPEPVAQGDGTEAKT